MTEAARNEAYQELIDGSQRDFAVIAVPMFGRFTSPGRRGLMRCCEEFSQDL